MWSRTDWLGDRLVGYPVLPQQWAPLCIYRITLSFSYCPSSDFLHTKVNSTHSEVPSQSFIVVPPRRSHLEQGQYCDTSKQEKLQLITATSISSKQTRFTALTMHCTLPLAKTVVSQPRASVISGRLVPTGFSKTFSCSKLWADNFLCASVTGHVFTPVKPPDVV
jgi:hypothetical protein